MTILGEHRQVGADTSVADGTAPRPRTPEPAVRARLPRGAWHPERGAGDRRFAELGALPLESGRTLEQVTMAYETWGRLDEDGGNAVLVLHALTGDSHVRGPASGAWVAALSLGLVVVLSVSGLIAGPGRIGNEYAIDLPRPRDFAGAEFNEWRRLLASQLHSPHARKAG